MELNDILSRLTNVKRSGAQISARCPAHDDHNNSLSVAVGDDNRVLVNCHAGCSPESIVAAMGLTMSDLFTDKQTDGRAHQEAEYYYTPDLKKVRLRKPDGSKSFYWRCREGRAWVNKRPGTAPLYSSGKEISSTVFLVEGEKDVDTLTGIGLSAVSLPDGASSKWLPEYSQALQGKTVVVIQDNDDPGKKFAKMCVDHLRDIADVRLYDLAKIWPEIPAHGDVSDYLNAAGDGGIKTLLANVPPAYKDPFLAHFVTLDEIQEQEASWLVNGWIPEGQITLIAADGGVGKTTLWVNILAALSSGNRCILDSDSIVRDPGKVIFLTSEDSVKKKLRRKIREAGANLHNVITMDLSSDTTGELRDLKIGSSKLAMLIRQIRPTLCVFDPLQGFLPRDINMGSRNEMRDSLAPLVALGEEVGTSFLIICHSNKRKGAWGRDRIADSADLWDIARSVLMCGMADEDGVRYISQEKNNYGQYQQTILFRINNREQIEMVGRSWKRDRDFVESIAGAKSKVDECKLWIEQYLTAHDGQVPTRELEAEAGRNGYSGSIRRAKDSLKADGKVRYYQTGTPREKVWHIALTEYVGPTPFD